MQSRAEYLDLCAENVGSVYYVRAKCRNVRAAAVQKGKTDPSCRVACIDVDS